VNPGTPTGLRVDGREVTVEELAASLEPCCFLCGAPRAAIGIFVPNPEAEKVVIERTRREKEPRPGKRRTIVYGLCAACIELGHETFEALVEAKIFAEPRA
jgi:hypothetical protein